MSLNIVLPHNSSLMDDKQNSELLFWRTTIGLNLFFLGCQEPVMTFDSKQLYYLGMKKWSVYKIKRYRDITMYWCSINSRETLNCSSILLLVLNKSIGGCCRKLCSKSVLFSCEYLVVSCKDSTIRTVS